MSVLNFLRSRAFWVSDVLKGGAIKKHFNEISFILDNLDEREVQEKIKENSLNLLLHATTTVPYYQVYKGKTNLEDFPVINKNEIRENFEDLKSLMFVDKDNFRVSTSGSTGIPFEFFHDSNKRSRNTADTIYFAKKAGYKLGEKLLYLRLWDAYEKKTPLKAFAQNVDPIDIAFLDDRFLEKLMADLEKNKQRKGWIGYPSGFEKICKYLDRIKSKPIDANVVSIIGIAEAMSDFAKERMQFYFGANAVSRYSNIECGIMAQQKEGLRFDINWASYHVELLQLESNDPVKVGEIGRIVVTDYFNNCMPLIRYDTGDIGIFTEGEFPQFERIEGRKVDALYNTSGEIVNSHIMFNVNKYPQLDQSQLIQEGRKEYLFKLNVKGEFKREKEFIDEFRKYLGPDATISISYVDEIPKLSSGKRKTVVNNYYI